MGVAEWKVKQGGTVGVPKIVKVSASGQSTVVIDSNGDRLGVGYNSLNPFGTETQADKVVFTPSLDEMKWADISYGSSHILLIRIDGTLWSCGYNYFGQLGIGTTGISNSLTQIGTDTNWSKVIAGQNMSVAIKADGTMWVCGANDYGQLGLGDKVNRSLFTQIPGSWITAASTVHRNFAAIKAMSDGGGLWRCGLTTINNYNPLTLTQIGTGEWIDVDCGLNCTIAIKGDGTLWGIDQNTYGQLGIGNQANQPSLVQIGTAQDWVQVRCGGEHTFALNSSGEVWVAGRGTNGRLGTGNQLTVTTLGLLSTGLTAMSVFCGSAHSGILTSDGRIMSTGLNTNGQLANGGTTQSLILVDAQYDPTYASEPMPSKQLIRIQ